MIGSDADRSDVRFGSEADISQCNHYRQTCSTSTGEKGRARSDARANRTRRSRAAARALAQAQTQDELAVFAAAIDKNSRGPKFSDALSIVT